MLVRTLALLLLWTGPASAFDVWLAADPHVCNNAVAGTAQEPYCDRLKGIRSLERGILQSRALHGWDIGLVLGDFGMEISHAEGLMVATQFSVLGADREKAYTLAGNHDADTDMAWFRTWVDPLGENTASSGVTVGDYPYPPNGTWERYYFDVGNIRFLMLSDRNDLEQPRGKGPAPTIAGWPTGTMTNQQFQWLKDRIAENEALAEPKILIIAAHHMVENTTAGSTKWGGMANFRAPLPNFKDQAGALVQLHGSNGGSSGNVHNSTAGAGFMYFIGTSYGGNSLPDLLSSCGSCALWLGGHTHPVNATFEMNGMGLVAEAYGMTHANVAALTSYWNGFQSMSRILTLTPGSQFATLKYVIHDASGGYMHARTDTIDLKRPFVAPN